MRLALVDFADAMSEQQTSAGFGHVTIVHSVSTRLPDVGLQVWTGSLFLADLVLSLRADLSNSTLLELGSGGGLLAVVLSKVAKRVITTDANDAVLIKCLDNLRANAADKGNFLVKRLDWQGARPWAMTAASTEQAGVMSLPGSPAIDAQHTSFEWTADEVAALNDVDLIFAADVIYDDGLTDQFLGCLLELMTHIIAVSGRRRLSTVVAIEKRFNFVAEYKSVVASNFEYFMQQLDELCDLSRTDRLSKHIDSISDCQLAACESKQELSYELLIADCVPQWFEYTRGNDLVLCIIDLEQSRL